MGRPRYKELYLEAQSRVKQLENNVIDIELMRNTRIPILFTKEKFRCKETDYHYEIWLKAEGG